MRLWLRPCSSTLRHEIATEWLDYEWAACILNGQGSRCAEVLVSRTWKIASQRRSTVQCRCMIENTAQLSKAAEQSGRTERSRSRTMVADA